MSVSISPPTSPGSNFRSTSATWPVHLFHSYQVSCSRVRLRLDTEEVFININTAIPCGLIVNELISNALKHAFPDGRTGEVAVELHRAPGDAYVVGVSDDGVGYPQGVDFRNTETLGMQIVNTLVGQIDGTIELQRGQGDGLRHSLQGDPAQAEAVTMEKVRILIVEDEGLIARDIENMVKNAGYEVCGVVQSGTEAIRQAEALEPDLVLMDILLQGEMDGIEAAYIIRERFNLPVIYLTSHADETTLERAKVSEPLGYTLKPVEQKELMTVMEMALYKHQLELKLKEREEWLGTILHSIGEGVIATDRTGCVTFMNPVAEKLTGWSQPESIGKPLTSILHAVDEESGKLVRISIPEILSGHLQSPVNGTVQIVNYQDKIPVEINTTLIRDDKDGASGLVLVLYDLTERKRYEETLRYNAVHDHLTGLPNRTLFFDRLSMALAQAQRESHLVAIIMLDLDEFKKVNDTYGHNAGDRLLQGVAARLTHMFRRSDTIARLGGDEFVLLLPDLPYAEVARNVAERIVHCFQKPFDVEGIQVATTASLGVSVFPGDGEDAETLIKNADIAMYRSKDDGRNRFSVYSREQREFLRH